MALGSFKEPVLSGRRFQVTYDLFGDEATARAAARDICVEQTVEFPIDLLPEGTIRDQLVGRLELFIPRGRGFAARISFATETAGSELPQLLNVLFGNTSLKAGVRLSQLDLGPALHALFRGPRFGRKGLRQLVAAGGRPLLCTALKPMGLSPTDLAAMARAFALGGIDVIKDDHGLADQPFCPFEERVARCAEAVLRTNQETGGSSLYVPSVNGPANQVHARARLAQQRGAGGLLLAPGLVGWDILRVLAEDDTIGLPIVAHPAMLGSFMLDRRQGLSPKVLMGQLMRLCGADAVVFPHAGGRFPIAEADCAELVRGTTLPMDHIQPSFPIPAGGIHLDRLPGLRAFYGDDVIFLIGGDLHRRPHLSEACRRFREYVERESG